MRPLPERVGPPKPFPIGRSSKSRVAGAALGLLLPAAVAPAAVEYVVTNLGELNAPSGLRPTRAEGIGDGGAVAGRGSVEVSPGTFQTRPFLFDAGASAAIDLGTFGGTGVSAAEAVNADGVVVGFAAPATGSSRPFRFFDADGDGERDPGEMIDLGTVGGATTGFARGINDAGVIVGTSGGANSAGSRAFVFTDLNGNGVRDTDVDGRDEMVSLGVLPGGDRSEAYAVNDLGQVAGRSATSGSGSTRTAFLFDDGELIPLAGGTPSGLNNLGQVLIDGDDPQGNSSVLLFTDLNDNGVSDPGEVIVLPELPGATTAFGGGVNDAGTVVGRQASVRNSGGPNTAFVYDAVNGTRDLQALIDPAAGVSLSAATGINNLGQIAAYGTIVGGTTSEFALLLTPVPEPTAAALVGVVGVLSLRRVRRRA